MFRPMGFWRVIGRLVWVVLLAASWLGVVYIPVDTSGLPTALKAWEVLMPYKELALIGLSGLLLARVLWTDATPLVLPMLRKAFPIAFREPGRISLVELAKVAQRRGWGVSRADGGWGTYDLHDGLRQAILDEELTLEGRVDMGITPAYLRHNYPLQRIDPKDVVAHLFHAPLYLDDLDNFNTKLKKLAEPPAVDVRDLHLADGTRALAWLKSKGEAKWKGQGAIRDKKREIDARRERDLAIAYQAELDAQISDANSGQALDKKDS